MIWLTANPLVDLGFLPSLISEDDPRSVRDQLNENYAYGGGWSPMDGFRFNPKTCALIYPGDPPLTPIAATKLRDEMILFYPHGFLLVVQQDGSFEASRVD